MVALVNIIVITMTWGLNCEGEKDLAGSRMSAVFFHMGDWEDNGAIYRSEASRKRSCVS